jgi:hypothetical protein
MERTRLSIYLSIAQDAMHALARVVPRKSAYHRITHQRSRHRIVLSRKLQLKSSSPSSPSSPRCWTVVDDAIFLPTPLSTYSLDALILTCTERAIDH